MREWVGLTRALVRGQTVNLALVTVLTAGAGVAQAAALLLLVQGGLNGLAGAERPLRFAGLQLSAAQSLTAAAALVIVSFGLNLVVAVLSTRMGRDALLLRRRELAGSFTQAGWALQAGVSAGRFQELATVHTFRAALANLFLTNGLTAALNICVLLAAAVATDPGAAAAIAVSLTALAVAVLPLARRTRRSSDEAARLGVVVAERVHELHGAVRDARVLGVSGELLERFAATSSDYGTPFARTRLLQRVLPVTFQHAGLLALVLGLALVSAGGSGAGEVGGVLMLFLRALMYVQGAQVAAGNLREAAPYVLEYEREVAALKVGAAPRGTRALSRVGNVRLEDVDYDYRPGTPVLRGVDLSLPKGSATGLIGPSGSGKSTVVQILLGLREPLSGRVLVDGAPLAEVEPTSWFGRLAYVPQDPCLLDGSIADNIRFLRAGITQAQVVAAAGLAALDGDVQRMPLGYETPVTRNGGTLSGGQKQRLALARALVGQPDLLVLDEPTSSLDALSEQAVTATLRALKGRVTLVIVAHRLSTLDMCDRLVVVDDGRIAHVGSPEDLLEQSAFFASAVGSA